MMRASTRRELNKLRELCSFLLHDVVCCFCAKALWAHDFALHGNATGPKLLARITVHHRDGNHANNAHTNKALCHTKCHKSHHRRLANAARATKGAEKSQVENHAEIKDN